LIAEAAAELQAQIAECNAASASFAAATNDVERQLARARHQAAYDRLEDLKRRLLGLAFRAIARHENVGREMRRGLGR
jgi:hypothetical protein